MTARWRELCADRSAAASATNEAPVHRASLDVNLFHFNTYINLHPKNATLQVRPPPPRIRRAWRSRAPAASSPPAPAPLARPRPAPRSSSAPARPPQCPVVASGRGGTADQARRTPGQAGRQPGFMREQGEPSALEEENEREGKGVRELTCGVRKINCSSGCRTANPKSDWIAMRLRGRRAGPAGSVRQKSLKQILHQPIHPSIIHPSTRCNM